MKITLRYEEHDDKELHLTVKMTLPKKYVNGPSKEVVKFFVDHYNKKHSERNLLDASEYHLKLVGGNHLQLDALMSDFVASGDECYILGGEVLTGLAPPAKKPTTSRTAYPASSPVCPSAEAPAAAKKAAADKDGKLRCKRFGCVHKLFDPNGPPQECVHHKSAPIFHETAKWWSCCPDKKEYEFETFMAIPGCQKGFCSSEPEGQDGGKRFLGGADLRGDSAPVRLDANAPKDPRLKIDDLRKGLVAIGVDATLFEKVWSKLASECGGDMEKVAKIFSARFGRVLASADI